MFAYTIERPRKLVSHKRFPSNTSNQSSRSNCTGFSKIHELRASGALRAALRDITDPLLGLSCERGLVLLHAKSGKLKLVFPPESSSSLSKRCLERAEHSGSPCDL
ncbi:uncharacterized [Tachysurus ichikawai]